jgi:hypothetical protein
MGGLAFSSAGLAFSALALRFYIKIDTCVFSPSATSDFAFDEL